MKQTAHTKTSSANFDAVSDALSDALPDTLPKLLLRNAERLPQRAAIREKQYGIWQTWNWREMKDEILAFACGLRELGFVDGDKLAVIGANRPRIYWGMTAAQCLRGIAVPVYHDSVGAEMQYILAHAEARWALVENQEQVDKVLDIQSQLPHLQCIIYDDERGLRGYSKVYPSVDSNVDSNGDSSEATRANRPQVTLCDFAGVQMRGRDALMQVSKQSSTQSTQQASQQLQDDIRAGSGDDACIILYTSGTTGRPKGVVLSHNNIIITSQNGIAFDKLTAFDSILSYLPPAWVGDNIFSCGQAYAAGYCINCPENESTVAMDLREIGPTYYFAPPRVFENLLTGVLIRMEDAGRIKRWLFAHFMRVAQTFGAKILNRESVGLIARLHYYLGDFLVYAPLKNRMGFSNIRLAYTAGEAIGAEIFDFYRSLGLNIKQLYGQTEAAVFITMQPDGEVYADTVGVPAPGVEVDIADDGEVRYRSPGVFIEYYKDIAATRAGKSADGWVRTGDAGYFDSRGHLKIIDRVRDVGKLKNGALFAPKFLENKLKFFPQIREAVAFGDAREFATAMINIDLDAVGNWAERNNIGYASYQELAAHPRVYEMIAHNIEKVNRDLSADHQLRGAQIARFIILHKELDADDGEMTRTRKVRRSTVFEKYAPVIDALYCGKTRCRISTEVTFEDGRRGEIKGDLEIRDLTTFGGDD